MKPFTEADIQDYVDGNFKGDKAALLRFLETDAQAALQLSWYKALRHTLKQEETNLLVPGLADKVLTKIEQRQTSRQLWWTRSALVIVILMAIGGLGLYASYTDLKELMSVLEKGFILLLALAVTAFAVSFHFMELMVLKKKFSL